MRSYSMNGRTLAANAALRDIDDKVMSMYARRMTMRDICGRVEELYGIAADAHGTMRVDDHTLGSCVVPLNASRIIHCRGIAEGGAASRPRRERELMSRLFVGTYTEPMPHVRGEADGIHVATLETNPVRILSVGKIAGPRNPSYVSVSLLVAIGAPGAGITAIR